MNYKLLKKELKSKNLNQKTLATMSKLPESVISRLLNDKGHCTIDTARKITKALSLDSEMAVSIFLK